MVDLPDNRVLIFHHIPKTAGTSMILILRKQYQQEEFVELYGHGPDGSAGQRFDRLPSEHSNRLRCIATHAVNEIIPRLKRPFTCFTLVREPVERIVSLYYYAINNAHRRNLPQLPGQTILEKQWDLGDIYRNLTGGSSQESNLHRTFWEFFNGQARTLLAPYHPTLNLAYTTGYPHGFSKYLSILLEILDKRYTVGLLEEFNRSVELFALKFGWVVSDIPRERVSSRPKVSELPREIVSLIREHNELDWHLYKKITNNFKL
jgi:hypothetical protein